ncbi:hypothetical protein NL676_009810 [Syzygium grande]|nr:hypothetical protein NL676_009810 [Syzygium grande]
MANAVAPTADSTPSTAAAAAATSSSSSERRKVADHDRDRPHQPPLLPGLPDHIARLCLARVPPSLLFSVCRSWRRVIYAPSFPPFLSLYALLSPSSPQEPSPPPSSSSSSPSRSLPTDQHHLSNVEFATFDPIAARWRALPPPAPDAPLRLLVSHPSFLFWRFPIQTVSVAGKLVLLAATARNFLPALSRPLIFDPIARRWASGPPFPAPRRWCAAGVLGAAVYVASGIGSQFSTDVARSVEKWDLNTSGNRNPGTRKKDESANWEWRKLKRLKDGRFCRDAIEAVGWRGKLCMVNVKGHAAKQGLVYDVAADAWREMPEGMIGGWLGPVASMDEDVIYVVDEVKGVLSRYDEGRDGWDEVMASERLRGAQHVAAGGGRVCVVCGGDDGGIAVVDVAAAPARLWVVDPPPAVQAVTVHVLPRMSSCCGDGPENW